MWADYLQSLLNDPAAPDGYAISGATPAFLAARLSHVFDLHGSAEVIDGACCSSALAIASACRGLMLGEADLALAGGVNLILRNGGSLLMQRAQLLSEAGRCRPLDSDADGLVRGEGAALLVLKRRSDVRPHERVYAEIHGYAVAQSGRQNWIMAPAPEVQTSVVRDALMMANVGGSQIRYVELSCPGFSRGDDIELRALVAALGERDGEPCRVGSVKSNIGNLEGAASAVALIKVGLSLHHGAWAATLGLEKPNSGLRDCAARVMAQTTFHDEVDDAHGVYAGVTCVSYSGSNAHFVLSNASLADTAFQTKQGELQLLCLSSDTSAGLARTIENYQAVLLRAGASDQWLRDLCFTACCRRDHLRFRCWAVAACPVEMAQRLGEASPLQVGESAPLRVAIPETLAYDPAYWDGLLALPAMRDWFESLSETDRRVLVDGTASHEIARLATAGTLCFLRALLRAEFPNNGRAQEPTSQTLGRGERAARGFECAQASLAVPTLCLGNGERLPLDFASADSIKSAAGHLFGLGEDVDFTRCGVQGRTISAPTFVWSRDEVGASAAQALPVASRETPARVEKQTVRSDALLQAGEGPGRRLYMNKLVLDTGREVLGLPTGEQPSLRTALFDLGFTSLSIAQLRTGLELHLGISIPTSQLLGCKNLAEIVSLLV